MNNLIYNKSRRLSMTVSGIFVFILFELSYSRPVAV